MSHRVEFIERKTDTTRDGGPVRFISWYRRKRMKSCREIAAGLNAVYQVEPVSVTSRKRATALYINDTGFACWCLTTLPIPTSWKLWTFRKLWNEANERARARGSRTYLENLATRTIRNTSSREAALWKDFLILDLTVVSPFPHAKCNKMAKNEEKEKSGIECEKIDLRSTLMRSNTILRCRDMRHHFLHFFFIERVYIV